MAAVRDQTIGGAICTGSHGTGASFGSMSTYVSVQLTVRGITVLCHFRKSELMPVISCLTSLTFWSLFHVISIPLY